MPIKKRLTPLATGAFFILTALLLRGLSMHYSVIDHDESTYAVIAQELLKGKQFYMDVWDTKPIGIFLIYALIIQIAGHSVVAIRVAAALVIGMTAFFIYLASRRWGHPREGSFLAGMAYVIMASVHHWTLSANSEIFFNLFTSIGLFLFLGRSKTSGAFLAGLAIGFGFIIKYFVLFDLLAFWVFAFLLDLRREGRMPARPFLTRSLAMAVGVLIPFGLVIWYFQQQGLLPAFRYATLELPGAYVSAFRPGRAIGFFLEFHLIYLPFSLALIALLARGSDRPLRWLLLIWFGLVWFIVLLPGKYFHHYYFQLLPPLAFAMGGLPGSGLRLWDLVYRKRRWIGIGSAILVLAWTATLQYPRFIRKPDEARQVAAYMKARIQPGERMYVNHYTVLYFLLDQSPLHPYVHHTLLTNAEHIRALGVDPYIILGGVAERRPEWLVITGGAHPALKEYILDQCMLEKILGKETRVYRRRPAVP